MYDYNVSQPKTKDQTPMCDSTVFKDYHEKVKTVIEFYFLLPDFKSRGHPTRGPIPMKLSGYLELTLNWCTVSFKTSVSDLKPQSFMGIGPRV